MPSVLQGKVLGTKTWVQEFAGPQEKFYLGLQVWFGPWCNTVGARGGFVCVGMGGLAHVKMGNFLPVEMGVWALWKWVV